MYTLDSYKTLATVKQYAVFNSIVKLVKRVVDLYARAHAYRSAVDRVIVPVCYRGNVTGQYVALDQDRSLLTYRPKFSMSSQYLYS